MEKDPIFKQSISPIEVSTQEEADYFRQAAPDVPVIVRAHLTSYTIDDPREKAHRETIVNVSIHNNSPPEEILSKYIENQYIEKKEMPEPIPLSAALFPGFADDPSNQVSAS